MQPKKENKSRAETNTSIYKPLAGKVEVDELAGVVLHVGTKEWSEKTPAHSP